ncbi:MAG: prepilin-type N-terminal cleavage/methylation domain-containing protein [Opitutales bacterium]|nr:prepilin-type N-terminal cleavage/methylation domain-containing protein [Opitutales bacterium]
MQYRKSKKGFTLVEIMIVVVIIGLLAAMAIPAFQKVRENSIASRMDNDARQIASAAQQYFLEFNADSVSITYTATTGVVEGDLSDYVSQVGRGYEPFPASLTPTANFDIGHPLVTTDRTYNPEGQRTGN